MKAHLTTEEIVGLLKKTALPTLLVEGSDDFSIYRWIEQKLDSAEIDILACDGRSTLLKVFERRSEFSDANVAFVADRDMWLFTRIPDEYSDIIWTDGYSIENDLYEPSMIEDMLAIDEQANMMVVLGELIKWFAFEVEEYRNGRAALVATHPNKVVKTDAIILCPDFCLERNYTEPSQQTIQEILNEYKLKFRGKSLIHVLVSFLSGVRMQRVPKYNHSQVLDMALKLSSENHRLNRIILEAQQRLQVA